MGINLIINKPDLKSTLMLTVEALSSAVIWGTFFYFFAPLLTTVFWLVTGQWIFNQVFSYSLVQNISEMLLNCLFFCCFSIVLMISWSSWNSWRYASLDRRKSCPLTRDSTIAAIFKVSEETIITARKAKLALVSSSSSGVVFTIHKEIK